MLPDRETHITADDAFELLDRAVAARGEKHRYPKKPSSKKDGRPVPFYGEAVTDIAATLDQLDEDQRRDLRESASCHYFATERDAKLAKVEEAAPMCIVGFVLAELGLTADDLGQRLNTAAGIETVINDLQLEEFFDPRARSILAMAQEQQDGGLTWGQAVAATRDFHAAVDAQP